MTTITVIENKISAVRKYLKILERYKNIPFPEILAETGESYQIHHLTTYVLNLAGKINRFYESQKVIGAEKELEKSRLTLVRASTIVLGNALNILGLSLPEKM